MYTLNTGSVVVRRDWKVLPMTQSVIDQINFKAKGQPAPPIFTDWLGNVIGDIPINGAQQFDADQFESLDTNDNLPEVKKPETEETDKIPGVDTGSEPMQLKPNADVGVDFESPVPQEMPLVETSATEKPPTPKPIQASDGACRSTRVSNKPVNWDVSS